MESEVTNNEEQSLAASGEVAAENTGLLDEPGEAQEASNDVSAAPDGGADFSSAPEPEADIRKFDPLHSDLDDEELKVDGFYEGITEDDIKDLPTVARRMLHNFRTSYKLQSDKLESDHKTRIDAIDQRKHEIQSLERDFARRQAEFASIIDDPRIKKALEVEESEMPDIMSEEGIQARINRGVAEAVSGVFSPMQEVSAQQRQQSAYLDFLEGHPEMKDPSFKKEVAGLVGERKTSQSPISTQDAYEIIRARRINVENRKRSDTERRARADAARRVQRSSVSGSPGVAEIPPEVKKQGAAGIAAWLQSNPEAAKQIRQNYR